MTPSRWTKYLSDKSNLRVVTVEATNLVQELVGRHQLSDMAGEGLGEASIGLLLIASAQKDGNRLNLSVRGDGLLKQAVIDAYPEGHVRGYIIENKGTPNTENVGPWGRGMLSVLYTKYEESEQPYIGTVPMMTGYLAKDLTHFWLQSAQLPSVVGLKVKIEGGRVIKACGMLLQTLGNASVEERNIVFAFEDRVQEIVEDVSKASEAIDILTKLVPQFSFSVIEDSYLRFQCNCSAERVERAVTMTGSEEMQSMIDKGEDIKARCEFCNTEYTITVDRLRVLKKATSTN